MRIVRAVDGSEHSQWEYKRLRPSHPDAAHASISEADIGGIHEGTEAHFRVDAYPKQFFEGLVTQVRNAPIHIQNVVTYDVVITVSNPDLKLKPGMTANVTIVTAQKEDPLRVPNGALRFRMPNAEIVESSLNRGDRGLQPGRGMRQKTAFGIGTARL